MNKNVLQIFALTILFRTVYSMYDDEELFYENSFPKRKQSASGLIPFPRVGRSNEKSWRTNLDTERVNKKREGLIPFPRVGRSNNQLNKEQAPTWSNIYPEVDLATIMKKFYRYSFPRLEMVSRSEDRKRKIEGLMPFPRIGRSTRRNSEEPSNLSALRLDFKIGRNDRYSTDSSLLLTQKDYGQNLKENGYESSRDTKSSLNEIDLQL